MNRRKIVLIITLMGISLSGITFIQIHWMRNAIKLNEENFDRTVNEVLASVVERVEKEKTIQSAVAKSKSTKLDTMSKMGSFPQQKQIGKGITRSARVSYASSSTRAQATQGVNGPNQELDSIVVPNPLRQEYLTIEWSENQMEKRLDSAILGLRPRQYNVIKFPKAKYLQNRSAPGSRMYQLSNPNSNDKLTVEYIGGNGSYKLRQSRNEKNSQLLVTSSVVDTKRHQDDILIFESINKPNSEDVKLVKFLSLADTNSHYDINTSTGVLSFKTDTLVVEVKLEKFLRRVKDQERVLEQLANELDAGKLNVKDRVDFKSLGKLLADELDSKGLSGPFEYAIITNDSIKTLDISSEGFSANRQKNLCSVYLFPNNIIPLDNYLEVCFPEKDYTVYSALVLPASASLFFTLIILLTFSVTLITLFRQKRLAEMKADFINNVTHELKTPIATIGLAADSIENAKVVAKPDAVKYFTTIIREENTRMNRLVERVLQTARLERKTLRLNLVEVEMCALIIRVTKQMQIIAADKGGTIHPILPDKPVSMLADENLIENVLLNLLDNALKYCNQSPVVVIRLKELPGGISLSVEDNGIGISRANQPRVFDKFFRVSHGDIHNTKGFGLGLSYVKEVTELHGGIVQLHSELEKGSTFTLFFLKKMPGNEQ